MPPYIQLIYKRELGNSSNRDAENLKAIWSYLYPGDWSVTDSAIIGVVGVEIGNVAMRQNKDVWEVSYPEG